MPQKSQTITVNGYDANRLQSIAYRTLEQLGWTTKYAGENVLIAYTPGNWKKYANEITVETKDNQLAITSKMIHGESFDLTNRNKKNIANFLSAFETTKSKATDLHIEGWQEKIGALKDDTVKAVVQEEKQAEEIDKVMNFSKSNLYILYSIIAINVLVFVLMIVGGVDFISPTGIDIIRWGGNFGTLTLSGDWWRLLSCVFVHIGIIHLVFNMYALYMAGIYLEPLLGKGRFIVAYLCTGVFASLVSLWWHDTPVASAGASGAIFGMYGVFLALLSTNLIPKQIKNSLLQSIGVFVVYNLVYGMKSGVDNAAHIGGLISGLAIGYLSIFGMKGENPDKKKMPIVAGISIVTVVAMFFYLENNKVSSEKGNEIRQELTVMGYKDIDEFNSKYNSIIELQNEALAPLNDNSLSDEQLIEKLKTNSLSRWERADQLAKKLKTYDVSDQSKQKAVLMEEYISLRKKEIELHEKRVSGNDPAVSIELNELIEKINKTVEELQKL